MRALDVVAGQQVTAGQQIGEVGDLGNATGCHLHFEVHPRGGGYLEDQVDPVPWLAANAGHSVPTGGTPLVGPANRP
jgi:murein DD-endopeptidase MepM/ murein hydrolase activator NlpD